MPAPDDPKYTQATEGAVQGGLMTDKERDTLAAKIEGSLSAAFEDEDSPPAAEEAAEAVVSTETETDDEEDVSEEIPDQAVSEDESSQEETGVEDDVVDDDDEGAAAGTQVTVPTLPSAHRRSMLAADWTDEEIDEFLLDAQATGTLTRAREMALRIHDKRSNEIASWAELGRQKKAEAEGGTAQTSTTEAAFEEIDIEAVAAEYGQEDMLRAILGPVNSMIRQMQTMLPDLTEGVHVVRQQQKAARLDSINRFFASDDMKPFEELYGAGPTEKVEQKFMDKRSAVLAQADLILSGAQVAGENIDALTAMQMAHESVSAEFRAKSASKTVKRRMKKRSAGVSLRPNARGTTPETKGGKPKNREQLERDTARRLADLKL